MTSGTVRCIHFGAALRIAGSLRRIGWRIGIAEEIGPGPGTNPRDKTVDLLVGEHSTGTLRESRHRRARHSVAGRATNRRIVGNREENGIAQSGRGSALASRTVASCAVLCVENLKVRDLVGSEPPVVQAGRWNCCRQHQPRQQRSRRIE